MSTSSKKVIQNYYTRRSKKNTALREYQLHDLLYYFLPFSSVSYLFFHLVIFNFLISLSTYVIFDLERGGEMLHLFLNRSILLFSSISLRNIVLEILSSSILIILHWLLISIGFFVTWLLQYSVLGYFFFCNSLQLFTSFFNLLLSPFLWFSWYFDYQKKLFAFCRTVV